MIFYTTVVVKLITRSKIFLYVRPLDKSHYANVFLPNLYGFLIRRARHQKMMTSRFNLEHHLIITIEDHISIIVGYNFPKFGYSNNLIKAVDYGKLKQCTDAGANRRRSNRNGPDNLFPITGGRILRNKNTNVKRFYLCSITISISIW